MKKWRSLPILALVVALVSPQCGAVSQRAIPDDNLAYPVLIIVVILSYVSVLFQKTSDSVYLVTAKHVLFNTSNQLLSPNLDLLSYSKDPADLTKNRFTIDLTILQMSGDVKPHPTQDVAVVRLFRFAPQPAPIPAVQSGVAPATQPSVPPAIQPGEASGPQMMFPLPGVTVQNMSPLGTVGVALESIKTFDQVLAGNEVVLFGFPSSLALQALQQLDPTRPLLRKGIVAGTNPDKKSIILDCPSYPGNSGGPVLEIDHDGFQIKLRIIGVVNQFVPFIQTGGSQTFAMQIASNSGYSIITPMDFVLELTH
jgi:hypothetical protein